MTGASGAIYGLRLLEELKRAGCQVFLVLSAGAVATIAQETDLDLAKRILGKADEFFDNSEVGASLASGSFHFDAMVIAPCSLNSLSMLHAGRADSLIGRCALVAQKEHRRLILMPRETPLPAVSLLQMYELAMRGVDLAMAAPAFYHRPTNIADLVDFMVARVLNLLNIEHALQAPWNHREAKI